MIESERAGIRYVTNKRSTRTAVADLQSRSFALDVALVKALGGGYSINHP